MNIHKADLDIIKELLTVSDWFVCASWLEKNNQEVHFEVSNEDGEQYFFKLASALVGQAVKYKGNDALDTFRYAEEDMLSLSVALIDADYGEMDSITDINQQLFERYYIS